MDSGARQELGIPAVRHSVPSPVSAATACCKRVSSNWGNLPVQLEFIVNDAQADQLLAMIEEAGLNLEYAITPVEFGLMRSKG
jgi:hypothetical protein